MPGVDQLQLELLLLFHNVPHRFPVDAGRLHGHRIHLTGHEPEPQTLQLTPHGSELLLPLLHRLLAVPHKHAGHDGLLVHIQRTATLMYDSHTSLSAAGRGRSNQYRLSFACLLKSLRLPRLSGQKGLLLVVPGKRPDQVHRRVRIHHPIWGLFVHPALPIIS